MLALVRIYLPVYSVLSDSDHYQSKAELEKELATFMDILRAL